MKALNVKRQKRPTKAYLQAREAIEDEGNLAAYQWATLRCLRVQSVDRPSEGNAHHKSPRTAFA